MMTNEEGVKLRRVSEVIAKSRRTLAQAEGLFKELNDAFDELQAETELQRQQLNRRRK